jgi:hypothetical protein
MLGLDNMRSLGKGVHQSCVCSCEVCKPIVHSAGLSSCCNHLSPFCGVTTLWKSIVCPKGELDLFHKRICLMGQCPDCGVDIFFFAPLKFQLKGWCNGIAKGMCLLSNLFHLRWKLSFLFMRYLMHLASSSHHIGFKRELRHPFLKHLTVLEHYYVALHCPCYGTKWWGNQLHIWIWLL